MSRIYQGGSSDRRYQGRRRGVSYQPTQVASNVKALQQQGQKVLNDLKTKERERQRGDKLDNLERDTSFKAEQVNLRVDQQAEAGRFKFQQNAEKLALKNAQFMETQELKNISTDASNKFANTQLELKNTFQETQQASKFAQDRAFSTQTQSLKSTQLASQQALKAQQLDENFIIGANNRGLQAQNAIDRAELSAQQASERAGLQTTQAVIGGLIEFAGIGIKVAEAIQENQLEQEKIELEKAEYGYLLSGGATGNDSVEGVIADQRDLNTVEVAEEQAFTQVSGNNPITSEQLRQPEADASMNRNLRQASIGEASIRFQGDFDALIEDPTFRALMPDGTSKSLGELRDSSELNDFLTSAARQLTSEYGVSGKDKHALLLNYAKKAKAAQNLAYSRLAPQMRSANQSERYDAALSSAAAYAANGNYQLAWETARTGAISSGNFFGKSNKEINDAVFKDLMSRLPDGALPELKNVQKIPGQKGTEFGKDRFYNDMINDEIAARNSDTIRADTQTSKLNNIKVKEITNEIRSQLLGSTDADSARAIREEGISQLRALGTPEADDAINKMLQGGLSTNNNVYLELVEAFESGNPPTSEQIADARMSGAITQQQMNDLKQRGQFGDELDRRFKATGLPEPEKLVESIVTQALSKMGFDAQERKGAAAGIVANLTPEFEAKIDQFLVNNPGATPGEIQTEVARLQDLIYKDLNPERLEEGRLKKGADGSIDFSYSTTEVGTVQTRVNPYTGKSQRVYANVDVNDVPKTASLHDVFITRDEFLGAAEVWQAGGQNYSARIQALAKKLGVSPAWFTKMQGRALGYPPIEDISPSAPVLPPTTDLRSGFNAIQSMGFPIRGAAYLAGNIMQESSWNGQRSWGEVQGDGSDRNGGLVSWMDGVAHNNFRLTKIEKYLGKTIDQATPAEQLQAMKWEMQRDYSESYRIFMNPNSTDTQLRRASRLYWGYGHEGDRYSYAQSLL